MDALPTTGWIDAVLALTALEALALALYHRMTGRGIAPADFVLTLAAGIALLLALRSTMADGFGVAAAAWMLAGGAAHVADLRRRWSARRAAGAR
jgi:hypothetical protein